MSRQKPLSRIDRADSSELLSFEQDRAIQLLDAHTLARPHQRRAWRVERFARVQAHGPLEQRQRAARVRPLAEAIAPTLERRVGVPGVRRSASANSCSGARQIAEAQRDAPGHQVRLRR